MIAMLFRLWLILTIAIGPGVPLGFCGLAPVSSPELIAGLAGAPEAGSCGEDGMCCCGIASSCSCVMDAPAPIEAPKAPAPTRVDLPDLSASVEFRSAALPDDNHGSPSIRWSMREAPSVWTEASRPLLSVWRT